MAEMRVVTNLLRPDAFLQSVEFSGCAIVAESVVDACFSSALGIDRSMIRSSSASDAYTPDGACVGSMISSLDAVALPLVNSESIPKESIFSISLASSLSIDMPFAVDPRLTIASRKSFFWALCTMRSSIVPLLTKR